MQRVQAQLAGGEGAGSAEAAAPPLELRFVESRGQIARHAWLGRGLLLVGFSSGVVALVPTTGPNASQEVYAQRHLSVGMADMAVSPDRTRAGTHQARASP